MTRSASFPAYRSQPASRMARIVSNRSSHTTLYPRLGKIPARTPEARPPGFAAIDEFDHAAAEDISVRLDVHDFPAAVVSRDQNGKQEAAPPSRVVVDRRTAQPVAETDHQRPRRRRGEGPAGFDGLHPGLIRQEWGAVVDHAKERALEWQRGMMIQPALIASDPFGPAGDIAGAENQGFEIARHFAGKPLRVERDCNSAPRAKADT
jgi:hypothetical protein